MRTVQNVNGHSTIVSNEEYTLIQKIKARKIVPEETRNEQYQELADKLVSRGVLNKEPNDEGVEVYSPVRSPK